MQSEPAITITAITTAVTAILGLLVAFGLDIDSAQQNAILTAIAAVWAIVTPLWIRSKVWAPDTVEEVVEEAHVRGARGQAAPKVGT